MRRGERQRDARTEAEPHEHHRAAVQVELDDERAQVLNQRVLVVRARAVAVAVAAEVGGPHAVAASRERDAEVAQPPAGLAEIVKEHHVHDVGVVGLAPDVVPQPRADGERQELLRPRAEDAVPERLRFGERRAPLGGRDPERASRERRGDGLARRARLLTGGGVGEHAEAREAGRAKGRRGRPRSRRRDRRRLGFARRSLEKRLELVRVHGGGVDETTARVAEAEDDASGVLRRARASRGASSLSVGDERFPERHRRPGRKATRQR
jgi:hypothetical protein